MAIVSNGLVGDGCSDTNLAFPVSDCSQTREHITAYQMMFYQWTECLRKDEFRPRESPVQGARSLRRRFKSSLRIIPGRFILLRPLQMIPDHTGANICGSTLPRAVSDVQ
jgi:hypothetical protein